MYWQRWKAHGDGGSFGRAHKRSECWRLYHLVFWKQRISLWHGKPFEDTNKKHIQEILWLLCSSNGVLLRGIESLKVFFFSRLWNSNGEMTLAATSSHLVSRAQQVAQEVTRLIWKERRCTPRCLLERKCGKSDWLVRGFFFFHIISHDAEFSLKSKVRTELHISIITAV